MGDPDLAARLEAAHRLLADGDTLKARRMLATLAAEHPGHRDVRMLAVSVHLSSNAPDQAHEVLDEMLEAEPDDAMALLAKANCFADFDGDPEEALPPARRAVELLTEWRTRAPDDAELAILMQEALLLLAECESDTGDFVNALVSARAAVAVQPSTARPEARLLLASCAYDACACDEAREVAAALALAEPTLAPAHHLLGCIATALGDDAAADAAFAQAVKLNPADFTRPPRLQRAAVELELRRAVTGAPEPVRGLLASCKLEVADRPDLDEMRRIGRSPASVCVVDGTRGGELEAPERVRLFQRPLEMMAGSERELPGQILGEVVAAVGHFLGYQWEDDQ